MTLNLHEIEKARERIAPCKVGFFISGGSVSLEQIKMLDDVAS